MTIKEYLLNCEISSKKDRIEKLEQIGAPKVIIDGEKKMLEEMESGKFNVSGDIEALSEEMKSREVKKGRGGKLYVSFNGGKVNYFPAAKYGRYIKYAE